jgi:hypothetical protein
MQFFCHQYWLQAVVLRGVDPKLRVLDLVVKREKKPLQRNAQIILLTKLSDQWIIQNTTKKGQIFLFNLCTKG